MLLIVANPIQIENRRRNSFSARRHSKKQAHPQNCKRISNDPAKQLITNISLTKHYYGGLLNIFSSHRQNKTTYVVIFLVPYYNRRQVYTSSIVIRYFFSEIQIVLKFDRYLHSSADFRNSVFEKKLMLTANIVFVAFEFKFGYNGVLNI